MKTFFFLLSASAALWHATCQADPSHLESVSASAAQPATLAQGSVRSVSPAITGNASERTGGLLPELKTPAFNHGKDLHFNLYQPAKPLFRDPRNSSPVTPILGGPAKSRTAPAISGSSVNHKIL